MVHQRPHKKIVILGPTASGKTTLTIQLAVQLNAEIVSADSMQVYQGMDIGTAKPSPKERKLVPHHLLSVVSPHTPYNVFKYLCDLKKVIGEIESRGKRVIITGGTGLYLRAFLQGLLKGKQDDRSLRVQLEQEVNEYGIEPLRIELKRVDPKKYTQLSGNDHRRIIRALVYYRLNEKSISSMQLNWKKPIRSDVLLIGLKRERKELYERINQRVDEMIQLGLVDEVKKLVSLGVPLNATCWQAIGYRQVLRTLNNEISLEEAIRLVKRDSRRYAKRQLTWFRKVDRIHWFSMIDNTTLLQSITDLVRQFDLSDAAF